MTLGNGYRVVNHFMLLINGQLSKKHLLNAVPNIQVAWLNIER
jgi:hypothetical protein